mmetsp:Transcript_20/g.48  ORF Transcript_20/g.48 Transcript_20/m.48 type:complete len:252 (-) Transcript_20:258-1013(-)
MTIVEAAGRGPRLAADGVSAGERHKVTYAQSHPSKLVQQHHDVVVGVGEGVVGVAAVGVHATQRHTVARAARNRDRLRGGKLHEVGKRKVDADRLQLALHVRNNVESPRYLAACLVCRLGDLKTDTTIGTLAALRGAERSGVVKGDAEEVGREEAAAGGAHKGIQQLPRGRLLVLASPRALGHASTEVYHATTSREGGKPGVVGKSRVDGEAGVVRKAGASGEAGVGPQRWPVVVGWRVTTWSPSYGAFAA